MKTTHCLLLVILGVSGCKPTPSLSAPEQQALTVQKQMEEGAKRYTHFATNDILFNRHIHIDWPPEAFDQQSRLLADLLAWSQHPEEVRPLIKHPDAKVRTLALGALFVGERFEDLPLIASLEDDKSPSLLNIKDSGRSYRSYAFGLNVVNTPRPVPVSEIEAPQTVGDVARSMCKWYTDAAYQPHGTRFSDYWQSRAGRKSCASWFLARLWRATRRTSPLQPEYQEDIDRVLAEINASPHLERAWTLLYVLHSDWNGLHDRGGNYPADANLLAALQAIGPDAIVLFLQHKRITEDPDLWFDDKHDDQQRTIRFFLMSNFVLQHATELLRSQDALRLLECGKDPELSTFREASRWAAAAAELTGPNDLAGAKAIIAAAREQCPTHGSEGEVQQAILIGTLWRIAGISEKPTIVDWFYHAYEGPVDFLRQVQDAQRPDTRDLLAAIVSDSRFDQTNFRKLEALLSAVNAGLPEPLVGQYEIANARPYRDQPENEDINVQWRGVLRRHFAD